jgi:glycosyltransferase involved in cell wall biosynthesis
VTTSVVVPTRDRGELVLEAVRSALEAGVAEEVIVVDGGSTDGSLEELRSLGDRIRLVEGSFANAAGTRNAGAAAASGEFLAFLDSDDLMLPAKITCLAPILRADESVALAHGRTVVIDEAGRRLESATREQLAQIDRGERHGTSYRALAEFCAMFTSATLLRRSSFEAVGGYDESLAVYEDWDLYLRLALRRRLVYAPCTTAQYRLWPGNVAWQRTAEWTARVAAKHLATVGGLAAADEDEVRYALLRRVATSQHVLVRTRESRRAALAALRLAPARALRDREVRRPLLRSFLPDSVLRRRRP